MAVADHLRDFPGRCDEIYFITAIPILFPPNGSDLAAYRQLNRCLHPEGPATPGRLALAELAVTDEPHSG